MIEVSLLTSLQSLVSLSLRDFESGILGFSSSWIMGTLVRSLLDINSSEGLNPFCNGVARYANRARYGSSSFFSRLFTVLTSRSASPLHWGYRGLLVMCSNWNSCANLANSSDEYCGPLSLIAISGTPCLAKILLVYGE